MEEVINSKFYIKDIFSSSMPENIIKQIIAKSISVHDIKNVIGEQIIKFIDENPIFTYTEEFVIVSKTMVQNIRREKWDCKQKRHK